MFFLIENIIIKWRYFANEALECPFYSFLRCVAPKKGANAIESAFKDSLIGAAASLIEYKFL